MGAIKTTPQKDAKGQETGLVEVEITYGGKEAPFGGIDSSKPPAYIDPNCFAGANGFLIVDEKLCASYFGQITTPTLWGGVSGVKLLSAGTFYNTLYGQLNYAIGYVATPFSGPPSGVAYTFYITSWVPGTTIPFDNQNVEVSIYNSVIPAQSAVLKIDIINSGNSPVQGGSFVTGDITTVGSLTYPPFGNIPGWPSVFTIVGSDVGYQVGDIVNIIQENLSAGTTASWAFAEVVTVDGSGRITSLGPYPCINPGEVFNNTPTLVPYTAGAYATYSTRAVLQSSIGYKVMQGASTIYQVFTSLVPGLPISTIVQLLNYQFALLGNQPVTATASYDGGGIEITVILPGTAGNSYSVVDISQVNSSSQVPNYYFNCIQALNLIGGVDPTASNAPYSFGAASCTEVGGTLYIANIGPMILKYAGPNSFTVSSAVQGARVLYKFAGSLIGVGMIPQLGTLVQDADMMFLWSAAEDLDAWNPVNAFGNITGAGFSQLADIHDYLTGLIVSNNTAFILRSQGISYASALGSGTNPFQFAHIGLGPSGEGAQSPELICQYNETGVFIGNTDVFAISGQIQSIGAKIKNALFGNLNNGPLSMSSNACSVFIGMDQMQLIGFEIDGDIFTYQPESQTWMSFNWISGGTLVIAQLCTFMQNLGGPNESNYSQSLFILAVQDSIGGNPQSPVFFALQEGVTPYLLSNTGAQVVTFPQEELIVGRDVSIDSLYILLWANTTIDVPIQIYISGILFATYVLTSTQFNTMAGNPIPIQVFPSSGTFTIKSPQVEIQIEPLASAGNSCQIRFTKIVLFGSIDPNQKPV